jgi:hypothetical protein
MDKEEDIKKKAQIAEAKKKEELKKKAEEEHNKTENKGSKTHYDVCIEINTPMTIRYKVWAYDERGAAKLVEDGKVLPYYISKPKILKCNIKSLCVYISGTINKLFGWSR